MRRVVRGEVIHVGVGDGKNAPLGKPLFDLQQDVSARFLIPLAEKLKHFHGKLVKITIETVVRRKERKA